MAFLHQQFHPLPCGRSSLVRCDFKLNTTSRDRKGAGERRYYRFQLRDERCDRVALLRVLRVVAVGLPCRPSPRHPLLLSSCCFSHDLWGLVTLRCKEVAFIAPNSLKRWVSIRVGVAFMVSPGLAVRLSKIAPNPFSTLHLK